LSDSDNAADECISDADLKGYLTRWATTCNVAVLTVDSLLQVPLDARTVLKTPRCSPVKELPGGGQYEHFGIQPGLENLHASGDLDHDVTSLQLQFNIDSLPLFKSTSSLWPILCLVKL
jgi:hypothetical protein